MAEVVVMGKKKEIDIIIEHLEEIGSGIVSESDLEELDDKGNYRQLLEVATNL